MSIWSDQGARAADALARMAAFHAPLSAGETFSIGQRIGARLVLWLYGPIGITTDRGVIDASTVRGILDQNSDAQAIVLRLDSSGGSIDIARQIAADLIAHRAKKIAVCDRTCWSAAYYLASAAHRIVARRDATFMFHPTACTVRGNALDLRLRANTLENADFNYRQWVAARRRRTVSADVLHGLWIAMLFLAMIVSPVTVVVDRRARPTCSPIASQILRLRVRLSPTEPHCIFFSERLVLRRWLSEISR